MNIATMEAKMWGGVTTRSKLQNSITSLQKVHKILEAPTENPINQTTDPTHRLSPLLEKDIASNLAFLSVASDDSRKVMAVCVEEHVDGEGITIRIASNTGNPLAAADGFKRIGIILEQVARRPKPSRVDDIETLFRQVISFDMDRILTRLRSRHVRTGRTTGRPALITQLHDAVKDASVRSPASLINMSRDLQNLFIELEAISNINASKALAQRLLSEIVQQAHVLISTTNLQLLFHNSMLLPPSLRSHIPLAFNKLSRYYSAARSLVCAARDKKCPVFRTIVIEPFYIDMPDFIDKEIKVHAEIQLLFFYEMNPHLPRPRIICASKSACYLCNLYFRHHGGFRVPRSHGRLYKQWTLPDWLPVPLARHAQLADVATKLNATLQARIRQRAVTKYPDPNESVPSIPRSCPSTVFTAPSSLASTSTIRPLPQIHEEKGPNDALSQLSSMPPTPPPTPPEHIPLIPEVEGGACMDSIEHTPPIPEVQAEACTPRIKSPTPIQPHKITLAQLPYSALITATTPPLYLHLDNPSLTLDFDFSDASPCRLVLTRGDEMVDKGGDYRVVDVEDIPTAEEMKVACLERSPRELKFQLRATGREGVCVAVIRGGG